MVDDETLRILAAIYKTVLQGHYKVVSLGVHPGHGKEVVEVLNPDNTQTDPRTLLAIRS